MTYVISYEIGHYCISVWFNDERKEWRYDIHDTEMFKLTEGRAATKTLALMMVLWKLEKLTEQKAKNDG